MHVLKVLAWVIVHEMQFMINQVKKEVQKVCKDSILLLSTKVATQNVVKEI